MLPVPTVELVLEECSKFDNAPWNQLGDKALKELLENFPRNTDASHVLLKVMVLNKLYSTRVLDNDVEPLARHIAGLGIDYLLEQGALKAVEAIYTCPPLKKYYSFATKFCSWHNPSAYPIYDSYAVKCLWTYMKEEKAANQKPFKTFSLDSLWYYEKYVATVTAFRDRYALDSLTFRQIDKFLWFTGGRILGKLN